jgi:hypothetical protein
MPTQRTILFLGAGASKALGYPLTADIFGRSLERLKDRTLFSNLNFIYPLTGEQAEVNSAGFLPDAMKVLEAELPELFPGILVNANPPQITEVLSLLDHLIFTGSSAVPRFPRERLARLRTLLERAVATVVTAPDDTRDEAHRKLVERLVKWVVAESGKLAPQQHLLTVITTNYDLAIEKPLADAVNAQYGPNRIDYGFNWRDPFQHEGDEEIVRLRPSDPAVAFYKLHGSINWLRCPLCDYVYLNGHGPIFHQAFATRMREESTCSCHHWPLGTLLVAPSMIRDIRDPNLLSIWQAAIEAMRLAHRWVVVGYSLPSEDLAIRSLFLRASRARSNPPSVELYEHGHRPEVEARYRLLLQNVVYDGGGFEKFINGLATA